MKKPAEVLLGYDESTYHSRPELSKTQLDQFLVSPLNYWDKNLKEGVKPFEATSSMRIGSMVHKLFLEGDEAFAKEYAAPPSEGVKKPTSAQLNAKNPSDKTKEQIKAWDEYMASTEGKSPIIPIEYATALNCVEALQGDEGVEECVSYITDPEVTIIYPAPSKVRMRSRLDGVTQKGIIDLKTTRDASPKGFMQSVNKYNYGLQQYIYSLAFYEAYGKWPEYFIFVVVETAPPYHTALYTLKQERVDYWKPIVDRKLNQFAYCREMGKWPGMNDGKITEIG